MSNDKVATTTSGAVVKYDQKFAGRGYTKTDAKDFAMPFYQILQSNSPQIADEARRIKGAIPGMLHNTVTNRVVDGKQGILIIPVTTEHCYTEWVARDKGGGFRGRHELTSELVTKAISSGKKTVKGNRPITESGTELQETYNIYAMVIDDVDAVEASEMVVLSFTSTKIKKYKKIMTTLRTNKALKDAPLFANRLRVTTVQEKNAEGTFYNFEVSPAVEGEDPVVASALPPTLNDADHPLLVAGAKLEEQVLGGVARAAEESLQSEPAPSQDSVF